jgi:hypothetical protein
MIPLYTENEFLKAKHNDKLPCQCQTCNKTFFIFKRVIIDSLNNRNGNCNYCSQKCNTSRRTRQKVNCTNCGNVFEKTNSELKKSKNHFCSSSCAATYNNTHKTTGNRRSKLEKYLEIELNNQYPDLQILFNNKTIIDSELDIYIPLLKLAFELNGIFHYEPICGQEKLQQIQNNDNRKFQACLEQGIELCIIDTSQQKYFKEQTSKKYLNIILNILNSRIKQCG